MHHYKSDPAGATPAQKRWSVVIPAFNEEDFLPATLDTILSQTIDNADLILVDNKSTDGTRTIMEHVAQSQPERRTVILSDDRPGKINALETAMGALQTEFAAFCDADTLYPETYLQRAEELFDARADVAGAFAFGVYSDASPFQSWLARTKGALVAKLLPGQGHTGGYGHAFRVSALRAAGGYSAKLWPFMVADHEIVNRLAKHGSIAYARDHWCTTSSRRDARGRVDWTLKERLMYNFTPSSRRDWLFYDYLKPRFEARKFYNSNLRDRDWENGTD